MIVNKFLLIFDKYLLIFNKILKKYKKSKIRAIYAVFYVMIETVHNSERIGIYIIVSIKQII